MSKGTEEEETLVDVLVVHPLDCLDAVWVEGNDRVGLGAVECEPIVRCDIKGRGECEGDAVLSQHLRGGVVWPDDGTIKVGICFGDATWAET